MDSDFERRKLKLGLLYGLFCGVAFVIFAWGIDAFLLFQAHATHSFLKFIVGLMICVPVSMWVGQMTMKQGSHLLSLVLWVMMGVVFSWLVIWLPMDGTKAIMGEINPGLANLLQYGKVSDLWQYRIFVSILILPAAIISGLLEINLVEQALLNPYASGIVTMALVGVVLFGIAGSGCDHLINNNFREPILVVDDLLDFARQNLGEEVPPEVARKKHLSSVRQIGDILNHPHRLTLGGYDQFLGQMEVLVRFDQVLVQCTTIYGQPANCVRLTGDR